MKKIGVLALGVLLGFSTTALAAPIKTVKTAIGTVLAGENGMTLYTFKKDTNGVSNCNGMCAYAWPPLLAADSATAEGPYTIIVRANGSKQWAKNGHPLYFWEYDHKVGDTKGDGKKGVWDVARP